MALITGASRGIGLAIAKTFAKGGVETIICVARDQVRLQTRRFGAGGLGVSKRGLIPQGLRGIKAELTA